MKRALTLFGMVLGAVWAVALVLVPLQLDLPFMPPALAFPLAFLIPGLVMALMIGALALQRLLRDSDGGEVGQRVLTNTVEQMVLALLIWPFIGFSLGGISVVALGIGMALARLLYWLGAYVSAPLRAFGFAASFYPTVFGAIWAVWIWVN